MGSISDSQRFHEFATNVHNFEMQIKGKSILNKNDKEMIKSLAQEALKFEKIEQFSHVDRLSLGNSFKTFKEKAVFFHSETQKLCTKVQRAFSELNPKEIQTNFDTEQIIADMKPFFELIQPPELSNAFQKRLGVLYSDLQKILSEEVSIQKVDDNQYKITLDKEHVINYNAPIIGTIGKISIKKETTITLSPLEHGHSKNDPTIVTDQRRITFDPPITVNIGGLFTGNVESLASDTYKNKKGKVQTRIEMASGGVKWRLDAGQFLSQIDRTTWS